MTQEDKELLLRDLCARLPYGVVVQEPDFYEAPLTISTLSEVFYDGLEVKPYLRPMSSMTEEERDELFQLMGNGTDIQRIDFYLSHHFDYRCLIEKGLALEAPEGMYNIKENNYGNN